PALLETLAAQTLAPLCWVVVDDGSDDGSREWLEAARARYPFLLVLPAPEAADEYLGAHIARIKRWGLEQAIAHARAAGHEPACAGVLDADVLLPPEHYQVLCERIAEDAKLGVVSSVLMAREGERHFVEPFQRADLPRGPTQFFRVECLEKMGGLPPWPSFDSIANVKARALGYSTRLVTELVAIQSRETASRYGHAAGYARKGRYAWFLGLHPILVAARTAAYSARRPHHAGYHFLKGYLASAVARAPRCPDPVVREHYGLPRVIEVAKAALGIGPGYVAKAVSRRTARAEAAPPTKAV
ncbi:MAG TPA: glycosyltransferase family A protein, partial [Polyangiaceae bacterium]|nr:glycosyltransferase family A protein [Polyangiaceae bacterium]